MEQRDDKGRNPCAVLHGSRDPIGKRRSGNLTAVPTPTGVGAMLGHHQRLRLGEIEDLPGAVLGGRIRGQVKPDTFSGDGIEINKFLIVWI
jgi:hypothetical protein